MPVLSKIIIISFLIIILFSLGSALYFLIKDRNDKNRLIKALTLRISLSLLLFIFLLIGFSLGWLKPHSLLH